MSVMIRMNPCSTVAFPHAPVPKAQDTPRATLRATPGTRGRRRSRLLAAALVAALAAPAMAGDWPQILGPERSGRAAADERLADTWPVGGPTVVWRREVGRGYAGVVVAGERAFLFHRRGAEEVIEALDAATGTTLWSDAWPTTFRPQVGGGDGPLATPTVAGDRVVSFGAQGVLAAHDTATGKRLWLRKTHEEFAAQEGYFGAGSSPLVAGDIVVVNVGGTKRDGAKGNAGLVGFRLQDGATAWAATAEPASYSSPILVDVGGAARVLAVTRYRCLLLDPARGAVRWEFPFGMRGPTVNGATPALVGDDALLVTASYGIGSVMATFDDRAVTPVWKGTDSLATQYCTPVVVGDAVYAIDGREDGPPGDLVCLDPRTGKVRWREDGFGYGTLVAADGKLLAARIDGSIVLVKADAARYVELARAKPLTVNVRALPALAGGRLFIRDDSTLVCLDVSAR